MIDVIDDDCLCWGTEEAAMRSPEFYCSYGAMRHEELMDEAAYLHTMRVLREGRTSRWSAFLARSGRMFAEFGKWLEAAGQPAHGKPAHG
jgi:L-rhamnose isomerase